MNNIVLHHDQLGLNTNTLSGMYMAHNHKLCYNENDTGNGNDQLPD